MRYRYITCGVAALTDPLSDFRLLAQSKMGLFDQAWRVILPEDLVLKKFGCDEYSTTQDKRPLSAFHAMPVVKLNKKWRPMPELAHIQPHEWYIALRKMDYYGTTSRRIGYLPKPAFEKYLREKRGQ